MMTSLVLYHVCCVFVALCLGVTSACVFVVKSVNKSDGLLQKQITIAKKNIMENTKFKFDTYVIYQMFDGDGDKKLNKNELMGMLLIATMSPDVADATATSITIVGDIDDDKKLTQEEFLNVFGMKQVRHKRAGSTRKLPIHQRPGSSRFRRISG